MRLCDKDIEASIDNNEIIIEYIDYRCQSLCEREFLELKLVKEVHHYKYIP